MEIAWWSWWVLGFGLLILEMLLPTGFILLWVGAAAVAVGALAWLAPSLNGEAGLVLWAVLSGVALIAWRRFKPVATDNDKPTLNRRGHSYVGRNFTLQEPVVNGVGKLRVDDSQWRITGPDVPAGTQVRVIEVDGTTLKVEKVD